MASKTIAGALLRHGVRKQVCTFQPLASRTYQRAQVVLPQIRFASNDTKQDIVVDCSGSACAPIKRGAFCAPGTEEYCIAGHMPGEEEDPVVGDHSTVTPGQYSVLDKKDNAAKDGEGATKDTQGTA